MSRTKATESTGRARIFAEGYETPAYIKPPIFLPARSELIVKIPSVLSANGKVSRNGLRGNGWRSPRSRLLARNNFRFARHPPKIAGRRHYRSTSHKPIHALCFERMRMLVVTFQILWLRRLANQQRSSNSLAVSHDL